MDAIPESELIPRRIYRLRSRNLLAGVWNPSNQGFIGLRQKFESRYLDTEYLYRDIGGTAEPLELMSETIPDDVRLEPTFYKTKEGRETKFIPDEGKRTGKRYYVSDGLLCEEEDFIVQNQELLAIMDAIDVRLSEERAEAGLRSYH